MILRAASTWDEQFPVDASPFRVPGRKNTLLTITAKNNTIPIISFTRRELEPLRVYVIRRKKP
jgi:hypothetical protein